MLPRYLQAPLTADLTEKMVFVAGPRQVGKTTLAKQILEASGTWSPSGTFPRSSCWRTC